MSSPWREVCLNDVCNFSNGLWTGKKEPFVTISVLRNTNFTKDGELNLADVAVLQVEEKQFRTRSLQREDIILEKSGGGPKQPVGRVAFFDEEGDYSFSNFTSAIRVKNKEEILPRFLHKYLYYLYSIGVTEKIQSNSTGIRNLNLNLYKDIKFYYPSISEQKHIVDILDEAFEGIDATIANTEKNRTNARELFERYLLSCFEDLYKEYPIVPLDELASDITDGDHMPPPKADIGIPFITIGNIDKNTRKIDFRDTFMVPKLYYDGLKHNKKPKQGDVLYTVTGSFGIPVLIDFETNFCFQRHIGMVRPKPSVDSEWLYYLLMSPQVFKQATNGATGTAQKTVSLKLLRGYSVPQVPIDIQRNVVKKISLISSESKDLLERYNYKLASLNKLKQSLLQKAFRGELTSSSDALAEVAA